MLLVALPLLSCGPARSGVAVAGEPAGQGDPALEIKVTVDHGSIIGLNLHRGMIEQIIALGFAVGAMEKHSNAKYALARLIPPSGMTAATALTLLRRHFPAGSFRLME